MKFLAICGIVLFFNYVKCDTPANCTYEDIRGEWVVLEGKREFDSDINCANFSGPVAYTLHLTLLFPNVAFDSAGNKGFWTIVYNQGFEVVINYRKYFAFSLYKSGSNGTFSSDCDSTLPGWSHDVLGNNWACYNAHKVKKSSSVKSYSLTQPNTQSARKIFSDKMVRTINRIQKSWTAVMYPELKSTPIDVLIRKAGGLKSRAFSLPSSYPSNTNLRKVVLNLPEEFDWRNVSGVNYVSPVENQGDCGSCYAFSSLSMLESRLRVMTNNTIQVQFSPQDVVSCSIYSQGCDGGFPYVIAGKYAQDFGVLPEECYPYKGHDDTCTIKDCKRFYVAKYEYVGGFFGGCNEEQMKIDLVANGPVTVAFEVYPDLMLYRRGIYHHTEVAIKYNPFRLVNHGVLITGYGVDKKTGEKYWIVKNSWGTYWGENGYFKIRRGTNECNIETMAVSAIPIP